FSWASTSDICTMKRLSLQVNRILKEFFAGLEIILVDLKLEFGRTPEGNIILADEISPDTCRLWDASTGEPLDKDRFRKDLGNVLGSYHEIWRRITGREKR
ncbi:MAG: Phosphoribosylaminoimidazole-succinocarboxamide synthase, partial [Synergistales bacterium 57_84]